MKEEVEGLERLSLLALLPLCASEALVLAMSLKVRDFNQKELWFPPFSWDFVMS